MPDLLVVVVVEGVEVAPPAVVVRVDDAQEEEGEQHQRHNPHSQGVGLFDGFHCDSVLNGSGTKTH